jgi:hypothetical protein
MMLLIWALSGAVAGGIRSGSWLVQLMGRWFMSISDVSSSGNQLGSPHHQLIWSKRSCYICKPRMSSIWLVMLSNSTSH